MNDLIGSLSEKVKKLFPHIRGSRTVTHSGSTANTVSAGTYVKRADGKVRISMYSEFFSRMTDMLMCTNNMYDALNLEIQSALSTCSTREDVVLTILENSSMNDPESCESIIVGFRHYISKYREKAIHDLKVHFASFFALFAIGIFMEYLLYGAQWVNLPAWISASLDIVAWVLVWQFSAFIVFELFDEIKKIKRYAQINKAEYKFKHWE